MHAHTHTDTGAQIHTVIHEDCQGVRVICRSSKAEERVSAIETRDERRREREDGGVCSEREKVSGFRQTQTTTMSMWCQQMAVSV